MGEWTDETIDWYVENHGEDPTTRAVARAAPVRPADDVLDIGCGSGATLRYLRSGGHAGRLVGADPYPRMIAHARKLSNGIDFVVAAAEDLAFPDASFDGVLAVNAVHHWADMNAGFAEAFRVLRPGGWIAIGGEVFGETMLGAQQAYAAPLSAAGFAGARRRDIAGGFIEVAHAGGRA